MSGEEGGMDFDVDAYISSYVRQSTSYFRFAQQLPVRNVPDDPMMGQMQMMQMMQREIRRTDVELRHLTDNKTLKEMETELIRTMTIIRQIVVMASAIPLLSNPATLPIGLAMVGLGTATTVAAMIELS
jgi:hypothetical protein